MSDVTRILLEIESGDPAAADQLLPLVYEELRKLATARLANEMPGQTLQATALVHEAYLRLVGDRCADAPGPAISASTAAVRAFDSRGHFFAAAAEAMRRIVVENARQKGTLKRGGQLQRVALNEVAGHDAGETIELLALNEALEKLRQVDGLAAEIVNLRYFAGLTMDDTARALGISPRTAYYAWEYARAWLKEELQGGQPGD